MTENMYTYSQLASDSVARLVALHYGFVGALKCQFYVLGLHDNYLIEDESGKFILRVYRNQWRREEEIRFELELIAYLNQKTDLVAELVPTENGELSFSTESPEGTRFAALFRYADGHAPEAAMTPADAQLLARSVAKVHELTDAYIPVYSRQPLDLAYLLDDSVSAIKPYLDSDGCNYLCDLQQNIHARMPELQKAPGVYGLCIGDVNPSNCHIDKQNKITLFDFDQCGYSYRAFEIGKFFASIRNHPERYDLEDAFLKGYQSNRPLTRREQASIPVFEIVSAIWVMAIQVYNIERVGLKYLEQAYWQRRLNSLKKLASSWLDKAPRSSYRRNNQAHGE